eukprot:CAMPEP_0181315822 /NCGR_PEP_ID=MMETSP1101-20121128/15575_1 /TAXON_ID=46948 /ORGANISM="Rhodomonas abbreviata, Strain Caron Lab Isolate" /LENGTH=293 /DNA_ID=CAMNT_0023423045 /DNA_START=47 /DNA_END=928 /DNA_ORIENTATION=+
MQQQPYPEMGFPETVQGYGAPGMPQPYGGSAYAAAPMPGPPMGFAPGPAVAPVGGFAPEVGGNVPAVRGPGIPGARYMGAVQDQETGTIIDRYVVTKRKPIPVQKRVPEVQEYMTYRVAHVPETRTVQVPVERMVPREETVMVPRVKMVPVREMVPQKVTKMVPQTFMTERSFTIQKPVRVPEKQQRTIMKVFEGQKIIETKEVHEYERPRLIPGRFRGASAQDPEPVGVEWRHAYYQGDAMPMDPYQGAQYATNDNTSPAAGQGYPTYDGGMGQIDPNARGEIQGPQRGQIH